MHGKHSWKVEGQPSQDVVVSQLLSSDVVEYIRRKPGVCFSFCYKPDGNISSGEKNKARAEIQYYDGSWHTIANDTAKPVNDKWIMTLAGRWLPAATTQVKVLIRGYAYNGQAFKAWIDGASLSVYYKKTDNDATYGNVTLLVGIFHSAAMQIPEFDGFVSGAISVAAKAAGDYKVHSVELKMELLPNDESATTQVGRIYILYSEEANEKNLVLGPGQGEKQISGLTMGLTIVNIAIFASNVVVILSPTTIPLWIAARYLIQSGLFVYDVHHTFASANFEHEGAAEGQGDFYTLDRWNYWKLVSSGTINWAEGHTAFDWRFKTDSDDIFAIKVSGTVAWLRWTWVGPGEQDYEWRDAGETKLSTVISLANYWQ